MEVEMNETKKNIIFVCVLLMLVILFICSVCNNSRTNSNYRDTIKQRDEALTKLDAAINDLDERNTEFEKIKSDTDAIIRQLNETISKNGKIIESLQNVRNTTEGENTGIENSVEKIRQTIETIKTQKVD